MKKYRLHALCALIGGAYGALSVFLAGAFLRNLGAVAGWIMKILKLKGDTAVQVTDALSQLRDARIVSPYFMFILVFAILGALILCLIRKARTVVINISAWLLFLFPVTLAAAVFTRVNDILFLDMVKLLISIIPNL